MRVREGMARHRNLNMIDTDVNMFPSTCHSIKASRGRKLRMPLPGRSSAFARAYEPIVLDAATAPVR